MRVLHGPVNVGNQPYVLSRAERDLGADSMLVVNYGTWVDYRSDRSLGTSGVRTPRTVLRRLAFGLSAPFRYDVLHFYFGRSYLSSNDFGGPKWLSFGDLRLARRLGRRVFMTLQGCDVRVSRRSAAQFPITPCHEGHCSAVPTCRAMLDDQREELVQTILPLADRVFVLNPELVRYAPTAEFLPYASVDLAAIAPIPPATEGPIRILHAPSDEGIKGSAQIIAAVERLKARHPIELTVVKGVPHERALELYRSADLVIDQVLAGWYGGFAVEAMAMAKPVACYIRDEDLGVLPPGMADELPLVRVRLETLEQDLEAAVQERDRWREWGGRSRAFAFRWHDPHKIAMAMLRAYDRPDAPMEIA
jgi:hypothetical protein